MLKTLDMSNGAWESDDSVELRTDPVSVDRVQQEKARMEYMQLGLRLQEATPLTATPRFIAAEETALPLLH